jgi:AmmeMemoRadiSam system protein B
MLTRAPMFAGRVYPASERECRALISGWGVVPPGDVRILGGIVPHAGWMYSGPTAARTIAALAVAEPETVFVFGAVHVQDVNRASLFDRGSWATPLGELAVDADVCDAITSCPAIRIAPEAHASEHSIEVELPLIRYYIPETRIVPLMIQPGPWANEIGRVCRRAAADLGRRAAFLASTDLTHYGPMFGFEPAGRGEPGLRWAKHVNDRRFLERVAQMDEQGVVPEALSSFNACGSGAVAAMLSALADSGNAEYRELQHTTSAEQAPLDPDPLNAVGYVSAVFRT